MSSTFILRANDPYRPAIAGNAVKFLESLPVTKSFELTIKAYRKDRSNDQCRYLNGVAYAAIGEALGYDRDDISEYLCGEHWGWRDKPLPGGRVVSVPIRTTTTGRDGKRDVLNTVEFMDYVAFVQRFGAEHGIYIADPEPQMPERFREEAAA